MKLFIMTVIFYSSILIFPQDAPFGYKTRSGEEIQDSAFSNVSVGASFNFLDGLKVNDFYGDVIIFIPRIWSMGWLKESASLGFLVGIAQGRSFNADSSSGRISSKETKSFTVFFAPTWHVWPQTYIVIPYVDVRKEDINALEKVVPAEGEQETILTDKKISFFKTTAAAGPMVSVYSPSIGINFMMKLLLGCTFHRDVLRDKPSEHTAQFALLAPFDIRFYKIGLRLGGELRWEAANVYGEFLIYLAKEFSIDKLFEFIKK